MKSNYTFSVTSLLVLLCLMMLSSSYAQERNLLVIISDDLGTDHSNGYSTASGVMPKTPTLDSLRNVGLTFDNAWATPVCTATRAAALSGKIGAKTGVNGVPDNLDLVHSSVFTELAARTNDAYAKAVIGKWHVSNPADEQHPYQHGVDYYAGYISGAVRDFFRWRKTSDAGTSQSTTYVTSDFTNEAIDWIDNQTKPWLLWLAHVAPHTPYHLPPANLHTVQDTSDDAGKYRAMIEAMDTEIGRLLASLSAAERANTTIIYFGDNGTSNDVLRAYPNRRGKGTLYQGGIRVPFFVAGADVTRQGERESALVNTMDMHATLLELGGVELLGGLQNSLSFDHLLTGHQGPTRRYNYSEVGQVNPSVAGYTMRDARYKLLVLDDGKRELYDLLQDSFELNDLLLTSPGSSDSIAARLQTEAEIWRNSWSCTDNIRNGDEEDIDCGGSACTPCTTSISEAFDEKLATSVIDGTLRVEHPELAIQSIEIVSVDGKVLQRFTSLSAKQFSRQLPTMPKQLVILRITIAGQQVSRRVFIN